MASIEEIKALTLEAIRFFHTSRRTRVGFFRYFVYGWAREGIFLYIGMSTRGRARFQNHKIFRNHKIRRTDTAHIWVCKEGDECIRLERELIRIHHPLLNRQHNPRYRRIKIHAPNKIFIPENKIVAPKKEIIIPTSKPEGMNIKSIRKLKRPEVYKPPIEIREDFKNVERFQAIVQCRNKSEYDLVMRLINQGAL